jgi:hypothetical protein
VIDELLPALIVAGVGVVVLVAVLMVVLGRVRRFSRAGRALRRGLEPGTESLRTLLARQDPPGV